MYSPFKRQKLFRSAAILLAAVLSLPNPAFSLRDSIEDGIPARLAQELRGVLPSKPTTAGLEESLKKKSDEEQEGRFELDVRELLKEGAQIFPPSDFGWAQILRDSETKILPYHVKGMRDELVVTRKRSTSFHGRYEPAFDCFECAHWGIEQFQKRGYRANYASLKSRLWHSDAGIEVEGRLLSLTPGFNLQDPSVTILGRLTLDAVEPLWKQRAQLIHIERAFHPWGFIEQGNVQILLTGGIFLPLALIMGSSTPFQMGMHLILVKDGVKIQTSEILFSTPLSQLTEIQRRLRKIGPGEVSQALSLRAPIVTESDRSLTDEEQQVLERAITQNADLFYHVLTKLSPEWTGRFSSGLEEPAAAFAEVQEILNVYCSSIETSGVAVIGESLASRFLGLQVLAGMEERVVIERGPVDTAIRLAERGVTHVQYFGGLEETRQFKVAANPLGIGVTAHNLEDPADVFLLQELLKGIGVPEALLTSGLEELGRILNQLGQAA